MGSNDMHDCDIVFRLAIGSLLDNSSALSLRAWCVLASFNSHRMMHRFIRTDCSTRSFLITSYSAFRQYALRSLLGPSSRVRTFLLCYVIIQISLMLFRVKTPIITILSGHIYLLRFRILST